MALPTLLRKCANAVLPGPMHAYWDNRKWIKSVRRHHTRLHYSQATRYTNYLEACRTVFPGEPPNPALDTLSKAYLDDGYTTLLTDGARSLADRMLAKVRAEEDCDPGIWNDLHVYRAHDIYMRFPEIEALFRGDLGSLLRRIYRAHFYIFYGILYKSERYAEQPDGSQLWHSDGGPGSCINVMFCLNETDNGNGAIRFLPWDATVEVLRGERKAMNKIGGNIDFGGLTREEAREIKCHWYGEQVESRFADRVSQPSGSGGLVIAFRNNVLHRGGFVAEPGRTRYVCLFHVYPSDRATPLERYRESGVPKRAAYPADPADV